MNWTALSAGIVALAGSAAAATLSPESGEELPLARLLATEKGCLVVTAECALHQFTPGCVAACAAVLAGDGSLVLPIKASRASAAVRVAGPDVASVPMPATLPLLASALCGLAMVGRRRRRRVRLG